MRARDVPALVLAHQEALLGTKQTEYCEAFFNKALADKVKSNPEKWDAETIFNFANGWRDQRSRTLTDCLSIR